MGITVYAADPRNPFLATFDRNWGEWNVVASYIEAKGPPEIVNQIGWRAHKYECLGADAAAALGKWMKQALVVDDPTLFLHLELSEHDPAYALSDLKLFADFLESSGGFCIA
jgi:hypothetical protein